MAAHGSTTDARLARQARVVAKTARRLAEAREELREAREAHNRALAHMVAIEGGTP